MAKNLQDFVDNAAPPLAWRFEKVGDRHVGRPISTEVRDALDSERRPIVDEDTGEIVEQPVMTVEDTESDEIRSWYMKPAALSAYVQGCKAAGVEPFSDDVKTLAVVLSSLGTAQKASWNPPQRFTVTVNG